MYGIGKEVVVVTFNVMSVSLHFVLEYVECLQMYPDHVSQSTIVMALLGIVDASRSALRISAPLNTHSIIALSYLDFSFATITITYSQRLFREARTQRYYNECGPGSTLFPRNISPRCRGRQRWVHNDKSMSDDELQ